MEERKLEEQNILSSLKRKMERIKLRQARLQERTPLLDSDDHYVGKEGNMCTYTVYLSHQLKVLTPIGILEYYMYYLISDDNVLCISVIRSGDYFMFEDDSDSEESSSVGVDTIAIGQDVTPSADSKVGPLEVSHYSLDAISIWQT